MGAGDFLCPCGNTILARRFALGYRECLACGEERAKRKKYPSAPINKSNYMLITNPAQLKQLNPKRGED